MLGADVLLVKEERKVRGSLERLLTVNPEMFREADEGNVTEFAYQFLKLQLATLVIYFLK